MPTVATAESLATTPRRVTRLAGLRTWAAEVARAETRGGITSGTPWLNCYYSRSLEITRCGLHRDMPSHSAAPWSSFEELARKEARPSTATATGIPRNGVGEHRDWCSLVSRDERSSSYGPPWGKTLAIRDLGNRRPSSIDICTSLTQRHPQNCYRVSPDRHPALIYRFGVQICVQR